MKSAMIVFSPTGGTRKAADILCSALGSKTEVLDLSDTACDTTGFPAEDSGIAVIAMPSYGGRVPALAAERMKKVQGNGMPCVLLCVYGNRAYEDTLAEMEDLAKTCGFQVTAAVVAVAEHSIMHQYAAGRPDAVDEKNLREIGAKIIAKLFASDANGSFDIPGNRPYKKAGGAGIVPKADADCTGCGLCASQCPAGAIDKQNPKITDKEACISCMRCVVRCPEHARKVNAAMVTAASLALKKACSIRNECECYL